MKKLLFLFLAVFACFWLSACAGDRIYPEDDPEAGWYPSKIENELAGSDPVEPFNRAMFTVNDALMEYVGTPVGWVYLTIMPRPGVECIENMCLLLEFPARLISNLGSAEWGGAWDETCRFFINATLGIAGLFDVADSWFGIYPTESNFGQMFATWGIKPGCTFVLPLCGTTNVRDTVGLIFDKALDIKTYLPYTYLATLNRFIVTRNAYAPVVNGSSDRYKTFRTMMALYRETQQDKWSYHKKNEMLEQYKFMQLANIAPLPEYTPVARPDGITGEWNMLAEYRTQSSAQDTMRTLWTGPRKTDYFWYLPLSLFNKDFARKLDHRKLDYGDDCEPARYGFVAAPEPEEDAEGNPIPRTEKLLILLPGLAARYDSETTLAMAELYNDLGYHVAAIDNNFSWRYMAGAGRYQLPGYVPRDAANIREFLGKIIADLKEDEKIVNPEKIVLNGWSFGAITGAHLANLEAQENTLNISEYVLLNPPVDMMHGMNLLDGWMAQSAKWNTEEMRGMVPDTVGNMLMQMDKAGKVHGSGYSGNAHVPEDVAQYLISVTLRGGVRDVVFQRLDNPRPGDSFPTVKNDTKWKNRNALYDELDRITFPRYASEFLMRDLPEEQAKMPLEKLCREAGMYPLESFLKNAENVRIIHNWNDFLLAEKDRMWLDKTLGKRMIWFDTGGHLGNLYLDAVRDTILRASGEK